MSDLSPPTGDNEAVGIILFLARYQLDGVMGCE